jgi:hypothetical protein
VDSREMGRPMFSPDSLPVLRSGGQNPQGVGENGTTEKRRECKGGSIVPTKDHIEWPYVVLLVGLVVMVAATLHLLAAWVAYVIFAVFWIGFAIWSKGHR